MSQAYKSVTGYFFLKYSLHWPKLSSYFLVYFNSQDHNVAIFDLDITFSVCDCGYKLQTSDSFLGQTHRDSHQMLHMLINCVLLMVFMCSSRVSFSSLPTIHPNNTCHHEMKKHHSLCSCSCLQQCSIFISLTQ